MLVYSAPNTEFEVGTVIANIKLCIECIKAGTCKTGLCDPNLNIDDEFTDGTVTFKVTETSGGWRSVYPVGAIFTSMSPVSPEVFFRGSKWQALDQGRVLIGVPADEQSGATGGSSNVTLSEEQLPEHNHSADLVAAGGHKHTASVTTEGNHTHIGTASSAGSHTHIGTASSNGSHTHGGSSSSAGSHTHGGSSSSAGSHKHGTIGECCTPWTSYTDLTNRFGWYSKVAGTGMKIDIDYDNGLLNTTSDGSHSHSMSLYSAGSHSHSMSLYSAGSHTHNVSVQESGAHTHDVSVQESGAHTHSVDISASEDHTHRVTIHNTGKSAPVSVMQPWLAVYMWVRVA